MSLHLDKRQRAMLREMASFESAGVSEKAETQTAQV